MNWFDHTAGRLIDRVRVNAISREVRGGKPFIVKRRRPAAWPILRIANLFFALAENPARVFEWPKRWQRWESGCFEMLHGPLYQVQTEGSCLVRTEVLPGQSLVQHLETGTFTATMIEAAARELRRGHELRSADFDGPWSHGDPNLANFLFDTTEQRARMIDFEIIHHRHLPADERHVADLLVFLQDLLGCVAEAEWLPMAKLFLETYGNPNLLPALKKQLLVPAGVPRVWWWIRTNYVSDKVLRERVEALREALL